MSHSSHGGNLAKREIGKATPGCGAFKKMLALPWIPGLLLLTEVPGGAALQ